MPRRVTELMGTVVSQVAAGDRHTLALVPSRNKLYAFGVGGSGQLGRGPASLDNAALPQMVQSPENSSFAASSVRLISAGGNTSWAVTATAKSNESEQAGFRIRFSGLDPDLIRLVDPDPDSGGQK
jgi:E3 ubiquitin-protein ligase HERC4